MAERPPGDGSTLLPDDAEVCACAGVSAGRIRACTDLDDARSTTRATTGCGGCTGAVRDLLAARAAGRNGSTEFSRLKHTQNRVLTLRPYVRLIERNSHDAHPQDSRGRRARHGRTPLRPGSDRARAHRALRRGRRGGGAAPGVRPGRAHLLLLRRRRRGAVAAARGPVRRPAGAAGAGHPGRPRSTGPAAPSRSAAARRSPTTRSSWPPGAGPFVPPVPGRDLAGCFVYRTIEDLEAIRDAAATSRVGAVIGGGLLGLEAANALVQLGLETHVVEMAPRLMPVQLDEAAGGTLVRHIEQLGVTVHTGAATSAVCDSGSGAVGGLELADGEVIPADLVVFSAGIRPRDQLARDCGLEVAERGGVLVDEQCRTSDAGIFAIGECAAPGGRMYGLVAPGYAMAEVVVDALLDGPGRVHRRRHVHQAQAARRRRRLLRRRLRRDRRRPGAGLRRRGRRDLQEARGLRRRPPPARRHPRRRRVGVRRAAADGLQRHGAAREPRGADPARVPRHRAGGDARRGPGLLLQQRHQGRDLLRPSTSRAAPTCPASRRAPGPAPPAAPACRW